MVLCQRRRPLIRLALNVLMSGLLLTFLLVSASADAADTRFEVPITQRQLSNADVRFSVPVRVANGPKIEAMIDTGSFGLRVLARAVAATQYELTGIIRGYGFDSGVVLRGPLARALVTVGEAMTPTPINIQVAQSVSCRVTMPDCPAARVTQDDYGIGGDGLPHEGFDAILGLSMRVPDVPDAAINPLLAMGAKKWIIILPKPGDAGPGKLIINPSASDQLGFHAVSLRTLPSRNVSGRPQVIDTEIPDCPDRQLDQQVVCPPILLDSGAKRGVPPFYSYAILYDEELDSISVRRRGDEP
jgi:hypothetical protein